jgi:hypothetical protein
MVTRNLRRFRTFWNKVFLFPAFILLALIYLWPLVLHPNEIPMTGIDQVTDFTTAHLQYAVYIHNMWVSNGNPAHVE